jgi:hypothetical protein
MASNNKFNALEPGAECRQATNNANSEIRVEIAR